MPAIAFVPASDEIMKTWPPAWVRWGSAARVRRKTRGEVGGEDALPELVAGLGDGREAAHAGVVDEDLQAAVRLDGATDGRPHASPRAGRPRRRCARPPPALDLARPATSSSAAVRDTAVTARPCRGQRQRDGAADAAPGAGDQRGRAADLHRPSIGLPYRPGKMDDAAYNRSGDRLWSSTRTTTRSSGVPQDGDATRRSRPPTASSRASTIPTSTRATRRPRRASRRSTRPTRCCPIPRSASATTRSARTGRAYARRRRRRRRAPGRTARRGLRRRGPGRLLRFLPHHLRRRRRSAAGSAARRPGGFGGGRGGFARGGFEEHARARERSPARTSRRTVELTLDEVLRGTTRTHPDGRRRQRAHGRGAASPPACATGSRVRVAGEGGPAGAAARAATSTCGSRSCRTRPSSARATTCRTTVTVPLTTAVLGGEAEVPTLDGPLGIKVPPGSRAGPRLPPARPRPAEAGDGRGERGDLLATLAVDLPQELTPRERELFEELTPRRYGEPAHSRVLRAGAVLVRS